MVRQEQIPGSENNQRGLREIWHRYVELETSKHNKITIETVYRPPKQQAADDAALYEEIHTITQNKQSVIIGDFNCSNIDWTTMHGDFSNSDR